MTEHILQELFMKEVWGPTRWFLLMTRVRYPGRRDMVPTKVHMHMVRIIWSTMAVLRRRVLH